MISILSGRFEISWYWLGIRDSKDAQSVHRTQLNAFFTFIYEVVVRQKNIWSVQTGTYQTNEYLPADLGSILSLFRILI